MDNRTRQQKQCDWEEFLSIVGQKNVLQDKYLRTNSIDLSEEELDDIEALISFYKAEGSDIEEIADSYLFFIDMVMQECMYFYEYNDYRFHTFKEVADEVYFDKSYMKKYMMGLAISDYLLNVHRGGQDGLLN